jgi:alkanesulfonate monooxygenase SsuD/methylene tetrahydromethanopterin reductase-like flavin-dependent oxidoreductase (luciferase family)
MKMSYLASAAYGAPTAAGAGVWPVPPAECDRDIAAKTMQRNIDNARLAEEMGFDWVSVSEHHYAPLMLTPNPLILAGALTQALKHAKVALLGPLVPLANPVRLAEEVAMLDCISNGRIVVLFLRGTPSEHHVYADVAAPSREMTQEGIELVLKAWTEPEPFSWNGKHFHYDTVSVWPRTKQEPHPMAFGSGNSDQSIKFAARHKLGIGMSFVPTNVIKRWVALYKEECAKAGWTPTKDHILYRAVAQVTDSDETSESNYEAADGKAARGETSAPSHFEPGGAASDVTFVFGPYLTGGPRNALRQLAALRDAGVGIVDLGVNGQGGRGATEGQAEAIKTIGRNIIPETKDW